MLKAIYIFLFCLVGTGVSAQNMPERSLVRKGNRQYEKKNYEKSIERYTKALETAPQNFEATYNLGNAFYKAERFDHAEQTMRTAAADTLRTTQERAEAFYNLGNAQFKQEKYKEALESYKQSLRLNPSDRDAKYNYAYTKRLLDQNQDDQNKDQQQDQNKDQQQDQQDKDQQDQQNNPQDGEQQEQPSEQQQSQQGISQQEQEQMLEAIQAQEDRTQEKLKEQEGVVVRGHKNW